MVKWLFCGHSQTIARLIYPFHFHSKLGKSCFNASWRLICLNRFWLTFERSSVEAEVNSIEIGIDLINFVDSLKNWSNKFHVAKLLKKVFDLVCK